MFQLVNWKIRSLELDKKYRFLYLTKNDMNITQNLLFCDCLFDSFQNSIILDTTIDYLIKTMFYESSSTSF